MCHVLCHGSQITVCRYLELDNPTSWDVTLYTARTPTRACDAPPSQHSSRCAMTSYKGFCVVQCIGWASPSHLSHPSANSRASLPAQALLLTAPPFASRIRAASPRPCHSCAQGISITVIHPLSMNIISRAATTAGAAASHRDLQKRKAHAREELHGYSFVPFSVET
jgi:hypothetical protein